MSDIPFLEFDWDEGYIGHIEQDHQVIPGEVLQVLSNDPVLVNIKMVQKEKRYTWRNQKLRVVTAFDSSLKDARYYLQRRKS